ncbi:MAG: glycosyltransferase, partial [Moraxella sp.]|nr:glycosyltransferase [Moraxella sp.]
ATLGLSEYISYVGKRPPDLKEWLCSAHLVLALANQPESIGINVLKAIHLGTPVIGWNKGAYGDILKELYPRGLIKDATAKALIRAVSSQLDSGIRPALTHAYELDDMVDETILVYESLANDSTIKDSPQNPL